MSINIGPIEIEENFDKDDELEINMRDETYYFTKSQIETLRDHLTKVLGDDRISTSGIVTLDYALGDYFTLELTEDLIL